ncbi:MAG: hypothetical protein M0Q53_18770, partial [Prolixibacteraceae bacterium]|nr:hypothetical protein [Prolixibacteraceae bacterium]
MKSVIHVLTFTVVFFFAMTTVSSYCAEKGNGVTNDSYEIYTPKPKPQPLINGPLVYGCRPGHPFLYRIPCQGERPILFKVKGLPPELKLDPSTGIITGKVPAIGEYDVLIQAVNAKGK